MQFDRSLDVNTNEVSLNNKSFMPKRNEIILTEAKKTAPLGVEILETNLNETGINLKFGKFNILVLKVYVPREKEASLKNWVREFEEKFNTTIIIQRQQGYAGIKNLFSYHFKDKDLITNEDIKTLDKILMTFFGNPPKIKKEKIEELSQESSKVADYRKIPFIAIDDEDTTDPEDAFFVKKDELGNLNLLVAITDVSFLIEPRGKQKDYAINLGATIYGSKTRISTLGDIANYDISHLTTDENGSVSWVFQFKVSPQGRASVPREPFLARVRLAKRISPKEINESENENLQEDLKDLQQIASCFYAERTKKDIGTFSELSSDSGFLISEIIIRTKQAFANYLNKHKPKKAIFKVQKSLSLSKKREILKELRKLGLDVDQDIFKYPSKMTKILSTLQEIDFNSRITTNHSHKQAKEILSSILNAIFKRSYYENRSSCHAYLGVNAYCDIKGRLGAGIINQIQARSIIQDSARSYSIVEIKKMVSKLNNQMQNYGIKTYTLHFIEMLEEKLGQIGNVFEGTVIREKDGNTLFEIDGFKKWGILKGGEGLSIDDKITAKLMGYSLNEQRFIFEIA